MIHRLGAEAPKKSLVENYMIEIARNYKIEYEPDTTMFLVSYYYIYVAIGGHFVLSVFCLCMYFPFTCIHLL